MRQLRAALEPVSRPVDQAPGNDRGAAARGGRNVSVIIPCLDEEDAIAAVVTAVRAEGATDVIVVDGGSRDRTVERAVGAGARVVAELRRGYGLAVQAGIAALRGDADIVVFIDGDGSDPAEFMGALIEPIRAQRAVFVQGSRIRGPREPGSLSAAQIAAGRMAGVLLRVIYGVRFTDMSPFRAIRRDVLDRLGMREPTYGWNLEMLMRIAALGLPYEELAVGQRRRMGGVSKVSGNAVAGIKAAVTIAATFLRLAVSLRSDRRSGR